MPTPDTLHDAQHEQRIADAKAALLAATTPEERRQHADQMRELIGQRSERQIEKMERERGLA